MLLPSARDLRSLIVNAIEETNVSTLRRIWTLSMFDLRRAAAVNLAGSARTCINGINLAGKLGRLPVSALSNWARARPALA